VAAKEKERTEGRKEGIREACVKDIGAILRSRTVGPRKQ